MDALGGAARIDGLGARHIREAALGHGGFAHEHAAVPIHEEVQLGAGYPLWQLLVIIPLIKHEVRILVVHQVHIHIGL